MIPDTAWYDRHRYEEHSFDIWQQFCDFIKLKSPSTRTACPRSIRASQRCKPMNPAPPRDQVSFHGIVPWFPGILATGTPKAAMTISKGGSKRRPLARSGDPWHIQLGYPNLLAHLANVSTLAQTTFACRSFAMICSGVCLVRFMPFLPDRSNPNSNIKTGSI